MWKLVIEDDEGKRTVVPMSRDTYTVGRREGNSIRLTERNVSRQHAIFMRRDNNGQGGTVILTDLESYNGVFVNGLRIPSEQELAHGDLVQIGDYRIILEDDTVVASISSSGTIDLKATVPGHGAARSQAAQLLERPNRLVMLAGPMPGTEFPLIDSPTMTVGRAEDATISINHNSVSRHHCEIHSLGGGRFEIVDKGSSNGVRVNGAELRRGIIEANDVIELGDVRLKFIGAGQVFRPGATESQRLSAIGDRATNLTVSDSSAVGILPYAVFGTIVAIGTICAWLVYHARPAHDESVGMAATAPVKAEPAAFVPPIGASAVPGVPSPVPSDVVPGPEGNAASEEHGDQHRAPIAAPDEAIPAPAPRPEEATGKTSTGSRGIDDSEVQPSTKSATSAGSTLPVVSAPTAPSPSARPAPRATGPDWKQLMSDGEYEKAKPELMRRVFGSKKPNHEEFDALRNLCRLKSMLDEACLRRLEQMELTDPEAAATPGAPTAH